MRQSFCMIWNTLRYLITFFLPAFYKRIQVKNLAELNVKGPVIIAMNHPNAFTDPIYIAYLSYPLRVSYLARGDAFKPGLVSYLLEKIGIVPIFRIQDGGKEGLKKNDETYQRVNQLLARNSKIIVFAEGLCIQERRLRPLKKGVARMVFGAYEAINNDNLMVIPIGVNYNQPDKFRSNVFYNVGKPIYVKDFIEEYKQNPAKTQNRFLQQLEPKMKELITHINDKKNDATVLFVEELCKRDLLEQKGLNYKNLEHDFIVLKELTEKVNGAAENKPELVHEFTTEAKAYFRELENNRLRDWLINPNQNKRITALTILFRYLLLLLGSPLYLAGVIGNYLPLFLTHKITKKSIKHAEFYSSIAIGVGMVLFWINYLLWFFIVYLFSPSVLWPFSICFILAMCAWYSLYYHPFALKTFGMSRILKNKALANTLARKREKLLSLINKF